LLLHLGIPLTINPDDPGIFGYQDTTVDFFVALVSYNWTIRHLKLTFLYSIDFALCDE
jgi:adenosine deaminase